MKMTDFAWAGKCGFLGASGLTNRPGPSSAAAALLKKSSADSSPVRATAPKPPPTSQRNSRRVRPQNWRGVDEWFIASIQVEKLVRVQQQQAILPQRLRLAQPVLRAQPCDERQVTGHF